MEAYSYAAPATIADAVSVLAEHHRAGRRAQVLAGGTDMLVQMRVVDRAPRAIINIKAIAELQRIDTARDPAFLGAAVPAAVLTADPQLQRLFPGLVEAVDLIGSTQIQGRATPGGNLCNASPAGDTIPAMIANGAICVIAGPAGERTLPVEQFVVGVQKNALQPGEILVGLRFALPQPGTADAYLRFIPRTEMDIAVAGAAVSLTVDAAGVVTRARVAIGAVAPTALLVPAAADALVGSRVDDAALAACAAACTAASSPISDRRGTIEFRRKVVGVLARRAAAIAHARALEKR